MDALIEAALRDQERRVVESTPAQIDGRSRGNCKLCGGKLRRNNKSGFCIRTKACRNAQVRVYRARKG